MRLAAGMSRAGRLLLPALLAACAATPQRPPAASGRVDIAPNEAGAPFRAFGNEPGWALTIENRRIDLDWDYGDKQASLPRPEPARGDRQVRYRAATRAHVLDVVIQDRLCHAASGLPYPKTVTATIDGQRLQGCGGKPKSLLTGRSWRVENIAGGGVIDFSHTTVVFDADGRIHGRAGCNRYAGRYVITGETLDVTPARVTHKNCVPALRFQENRFLRVLAGARRFDIDAQGRLIIRAAAGETLEAMPYEDAS